MLLRFGAENYGSIRDYQEVLFSAAGIADADGPLIDRAVPGLAGTSFLSAIALFGPNAAGKSTLFSAISTLRSLAVHGHLPQGRLPYRPFALDPACAGAPTRLSVSFEHGSVRYEYEVSYDSSRVVEERLEAYPRGRAQLWFHREGGSVRSGSSVTVPKAALEILPDGALLLPLLANVAGGRSGEEFRKPYEWFRDRLACLDRSPRGSENIPFSGEIVDGAEGGEAQRRFIVDMVREADLGIEGVEVRRRRLSPDDAAAVAAALGSGAPLPAEVKSVYFRHSSPTGAADLKLSEESDGTVRVFDLSGYVAAALDAGSVLVVDEIDASLHPILVSTLVRCFQSREANPNGAQLLFTAHNSYLLSRGILRRDQVWFAEKDGGATRLYPLTDYEPRKGEALEQGYLAGRYGAVPVVPECFAPACGGK